ncbi:uncharacterized protein LOC130949089 [Arachis stenosperma]|uniref:uncharacterized protein LOC130949089 n=1 Tax=Arachis stenosperma TaxID=217475 RepID=UPI0025ABB328|nr:uncharacterized protein LOC130949089 [Arachis stenosperma]
MERGLRQGDPLSPFLFVLVVDVLHRMLEEVVRNRRLSPLLVGRDHIELSHLQFADDTILFCPQEEETEAALPIKYLGIQLGANPRLVKIWKPIVDKVEEKLSFWNAKVPNKAGKLRRFLWSKEDGRTGMALVRWEVVQAPKKFGGLGVGDAMLRNTAFLFKWWWRFLKEDCPLWKKVVCTCNNLNPDVLLSSQTLPSKGALGRISVRCNSRVSKLDRR